VRGGLRVRLPIGRARKGLKCLVRGASDKNAWEATRLSTIMELKGGRDNGMGAEAFGSGKEYSRQYRGRGVWEGGEKTLANG